MSRARLSLAIVFVVWSLLLFGGVGAIGWLGDGLAGLLAHIHLGWLGAIAAGFGKIVIFLIWFISLGLFALLFATTSQLGRVVQDARRAQRQQTTPYEVTEATVTLERGPDGNYR
jgi:hypothetical protein